MNKKLMAVAVASALAAPGLALAQSSVTISGYVKVGLDNVHTEAVMVPHWVRGVESAEIVEPARHPMAILGLGGSTATGPGGVEADVVHDHATAHVTVLPRARVH